MWARNSSVAFAVSICAVACNCGGHRPETAVSTGPASAAPPAASAPHEQGEFVIVRPIFDGTRNAEWEDWGWAPHGDESKGGALIDMSGWKGWQLVHQGNLPGEYGGVAFRVRAPKEYGDFLTVRLGDASNSKFPDVPVPASRGKDLGDGWREVLVPIDELDPDGLPFDRVVFFVSKNVGAGWVAFDKIGLTLAQDPSTRPPPPAKDVAMRVDCSNGGTPISPLVYGVAVDVMHDAETKHQWTIGATARRWGGNPSSRYNWQLGDAWNTANDWYFENVSYGGGKITYATFLKDDLDHGVKTALTIPMLGWVAKDTKSNGFPRSQFPKQSAFDPYRPDAGNGMNDGKPIPSGSPELTSVAAPPDFIEKWIKAIVAEDKKRGARSVHEYILDNEPNLWSSTHRDVHPDALTYDELLDKTIAYGTAIRNADPDAVIAGPAEWGWTNYLYSSKDMESGITLRPDRRRHGDKPLVAWYLEKLAEHEKKTGTRILDVLDLHFYPQGTNVYSAGIGRDLAELRVRQTRGLWDSSYTDESWIKDQVMLLPRMKQWIAENYPGRGMSIGEWSFGGEAHWSGMLAVADALGRFGQYGVTSAFYWTLPPEGSPAYWAFRAYRNFDGKGGAFESVSIPTTSTEGASVFASRDPKKTRLVLVALNLTANTVEHARLDTSSCGTEKARRAYVYAGAGQGFAMHAVPIGGPIAEDLPPHSITVYEIELTP